MAVPDEQLKALGRVTVEFQMMEFLISVVIWGLSEDRTSTMILTAHLPFKRLCQAALVIVKEKLKTVPKAAEQFESIMGTAMHQEDERNRLIHSIWMPLPDPSGRPSAPSDPLSRLKIYAKGRFEIKVENVPADDLNRVADDIGNTSTQVAVFLKEYGLVKG